MFKSLIVALVLISSSVAAEVKSVSYTTNDYATTTAVKISLDGLNISASNKVTNNGVVNKTVFTKTIKVLDGAVSFTPKFTTTTGKSDVADLSFSVKKSFGDFNFKASSYSVDSGSYKASVDTKILGGKASITQSWNDKKSIESTKYAFTSGKIASTKWKAKVSVADTGSFSVSFTK